mmetsp:Transcript_41476/g.36853  ORF Transcript_41476/g.36853 Transcript_41476/m.36853 type:complete len:142 (-) Transcript_41476:69-494(-)
MKKKTEKAAVTSQLVAHYSTNEQTEDAAQEGFRYLKAGFFYSHVGHMHQDKRAYTWANKLLTKAYPIQSTKKPADYDSRCIGFLLNQALGAKNDSLSLSTALKIVDKASSAVKKLPKTDKNVPYLTFACQMAKAEIEIARQ